MRRSRTLLSSASLLAAALVVLTARPVAAQNAGPTEVDIVTADYVTLKAYFYTGPKGKGSPTVLLLHGLGEDCNKAEWIGLAKTLNKHFAVMRFDFRGHGQSTLVNPGKPNLNPQLAIPGFYDKEENRALKGAAKRQATIDAKMFPPSYYPILANDIEAVKAWLDAADCDSSNLALVGAKEGATIGALWLNAQFHCYRMVPNPNGFGNPVPDLMNPEGKSVTAAVWLSMSGKLGNRTLSVPGMLTTAALENNVPMLFLYAPKDAKGKATAVACGKALRKGKKGSDQTVALPVPPAEKLSGSMLLAVRGTKESIAQYLGTNMGARKGSSRSRGAKDLYVWFNGRSVQQPIPARAGERLFFFNFAPFLR